MIEAARTLTRKGASEVDKWILDRVLIAMAKSSLASAAVRLADECFRCMAGKVT